jgi:plasmid stabilization system protein ParE
VARYRLVAQPAAERDIEGAFAWYQNERAGLGVEFLEAIRDVYGRIADGALRYRELRSGIRRALVRRFPYAIYFSLEQDIVVILAVLHVHRDLTEWQKRGG